MDNPTRALGSHLDGPGQDDTQHGASDHRARPFKRDLSTSLISLPTEVRTHILSYLSSDDLSTLSRCVGPLSQVDEDAYLRRIWLEKTVPARIDFALFSPLRFRPSPEELVRRGTLRGVAVISSVRSGGYWASPSAVRLSKLHEKVQLDLLRKHLSRALSAPRRPTPEKLHSLHILPTSSLSTSSRISAKVHILEKAREKDLVKRALTGRIGKTLGEVVAQGGEIARHIISGGGAGNKGEERFRWAVCPSIRDKKRFYEQLAMR